MAEEKKQAERNWTILEFLKEPAQALFFVFILFTGGLLIPFTKGVFDHTNINKAKAAISNPEYVFPQISDFWVTAIASVGFAVIEMVCKKVFFVFFIPHCKVQDNIVERDARCKKGAFGIYKVLYFTFAVGWGYKVLKDEDYLPTSLGGSGDIANCWKDLVTPYNNPGLKMYGLVTMGYHVGGLITHLIEPRRNDFLEMMLHHIVAFYLFFGYYLANIQRIGVTIAFLHDIADITANLTKSFSETHYQNMAAFWFIVNMVIWFWTRLYVLPFECIYKGLYTSCHGCFNTFISQWGFIYLLSCMVMLHAYWFKMFFGIFGRYYKTGKAEDTQKKTEVVDQKSDSKKQQ